MPLKKPRHGRAEGKFANHNTSSPHSNVQHWFGPFAQKIAWLTGRPATFLLALLVIIVWSITGPIFNYSDTWQLVINTGTTIVTFLMVFLIQNTQNLDTLAIQLKLAELILAMKGAPNSFATIEDLSDAELEALHDDCRVRADTVLEHLRKRRGGLHKGKSRSRLHANANNED